MTVLSGLNCVELPLATHCIDIAARTLNLADSPRNAKHRPKTIRSRREVVRCLDRVGSDPNNTDRRYWLPASWRGQGRDRRQRSAAGWNDVRRREIARRI